MLNNLQNPKIIVILGPTASGKSDLAVKLAKHFNGEVVSADSRQVYRGMDIGTGKVTKKEMAGVPHYLLDVASPKSTFTASQYQKLGQKAIRKILAKGKVPIICGGTGFYIDSLIYNYKLPEVPPNPELRKKLEKKSADTLFKQLQKLDPARAKNIDKFNKRRLIRALEIILTTKKPVPSDALTHENAYDALFIGIKKPQEELKELIAKRLEKRFKPHTKTSLVWGKQGMVGEVKSLHKQGISWKKLESFGLEYRRIAEYLQNKLSYAEMVPLLQKDIEHYAKRQITWFKRNKKIHWVKNYEEAQKLTNKFL